MHGRLFFITLTIAIALGVAAYSVPGEAQTDKLPEAPVTGRQVPCPATGPLLDIKATTVPEEQQRQRTKIIETIQKDGATIRLWSDVDLNFEGEKLPLLLGRCVTLTSVGSATTPTRAGNAGNAGNNSPVGPFATTNDPDPDTEPQARTSRSRGPILRFGRSRPGADTFLEIICRPGDPMNDGARISGFRLDGPTWGAQSTSEVGIRIIRCVDVEISNMEIAGWGESAIKVQDELGPDQCPDTNLDGGRIANPGQIRIQRNFIHHNQHPNHDGKAAGYGVNVNQGAWAQIERNVFDVNRHSITAAGDSGGYNAVHNLVLKGGGRHGGVGNKYTHSFDIHGTGCRWSKNLCGNAGSQFRFIANSFQFRKENAIKIRGKPLAGAYIGENIFPHPGLEADAGDDAIHLNTEDNVQIGPGNINNHDTLGKYEVGDFDGDGVDDLFLATGATWWFSGGGEYHWTYLGAKKERPEQLRLGYFDNDNRCDLLTERDGQWFISSGGYGGWQVLGTFNTPLGEVHFGRFDPNERDPRIGVTRRTTHAFKRGPDGQWYVTKLSIPSPPTPVWIPVGSSGFPMNQLRFGDFTGDGVTDVLARVSGRWSISESAAQPWRQLNPTLGDSVADLIIANMDRDDNIDDILRLQRKVVPLGLLKRRVTLTWSRSKNGREPWRTWKTHVFEFQPSDETIWPLFGFAGRFGGAGGGTVVLDHNRYGRFYSEAVLATGAGAEWIGQFPY